MKTPDSIPDAGRRVAVVHGRNEAARKAMFEFLYAVGLDPLEWSAVRDEVNSGSPYTGQVVEQLFANVGAVIVLLTGDDSARLQERFWCDDDGDDEKTFLLQPRPNVLFELGMAFAKHPERTIVVKAGQTRVLSDLEGRQFVSVGKSSWRQEIAQLLQNVGCPVKRSGVGWITAGNFETVLTGPISETDSAWEDDKGAHAPVDRRREIIAAVKSLLEAIVDYDNALGALHVATTRTTADSKADLSNESERLSNADQALNKAKQLAEFSLGGREPDLITQISKLRTCHETVRLMVLNPGMCQDSEWFKAVEKQKKIRDEVKMALTQAAVKYSTGSS